MDADSARRRTSIWAMLAGGTLLVNGAVILYGLERQGRPFELVFVVFGLSVLQLVCGIGALVVGIRYRHSAGGGGIAARVAGFFAAIAALPPAWFAGFISLLGLVGGGWGRPLRVRGRQVHPALREGADWAQGDRPDASGLDAPTRRALQALWLHDAQKEHASVPAFSRVSWLLAALGAPAELLTWSHRAALEEIEHARLCFALAAGYGGRAHTVQPMPELLRSGLELNGDPIEVLVAESLGDGCQLEDFNADVAAACAEVCAEPATRGVLERIAREERSHAELSWAIVHWIVAKAGRAAHPALERAIEGLARYRRPTAESWRTRPLAARADPEAMRRHGRLPDARWGELWNARLVETGRRARALLAASEVATPAVEREPQAAEV